MAKTDLVAALGFFALLAIVFMQAQSCVVKQEAGRQAVRVECIKRHSAQDCDRL